MEIDQRFAKIHRDPRFKKIPKKLRKVKIDSRFKSMFSDKRFQTKYAVDKRGRPLKETSSDNLQKFYDLSEDEDDANESERTEEQEGEEKDVERSKHTKKETLDIVKKPKKSKGKQPKTGVTKHAWKGTDVLSTRDSAVRVDRDEDAGSSDSSSPDLGDIRGEQEAMSSSGEDEEDLDEGIVHGWGELDVDARREENAETHRLAVCNLDWDKVNATDLLILFNSFLPAGCSIRSVKIYPSEFGLQRMKEEDISGPKELKEIVADDEEFEDDGNIEGSNYNMEKLRQYQLQRLRYYYGVVDCDTVETANKIYEECDGQEFELSACRLDLRFIPDDTTFDQEPKSVACADMNAGSYAPSDFSSTALHQSRVKLTWDETDPRRAQIMTKAFSKEEEFDMDMKAYLASSSEEDNNEAEGERLSISEDNRDSEENRLQKYRALIQEIEDKEKKEEDDAADMVVSWTPALTESIKLSDDLQHDGKIKVKTHQRKQNKVKKDKELKRSSFSADEEDPDVIDADDNSLEDDQDFIKLNSKGGNSDDRTKKLLRAKKRKRKGKAEKGEPVTQEDEILAKKNKEQLELLLMEDRDDKQHFSLKGILDQEKKKKRKKNRKKKDESQPIPQDTFQLDVDDKRFEALFTSHHYALDPSDSQFRKTKATDAIIQERQKRREKSSEEISNDKGMPVSSICDKKGTIDPSLSALVKSVKARTEKYNDGKVRKKWPS